MMLRQNRQQQSKWNSLTKERYKTIGAFTMVNRPCFV